MPCSLAKNFIGRTFWLTIQEVPKKFFLKKVFSFLFFFFFPYLWESVNWMIHKRQKLTMPFVKIIWHTRSKQANYFINTRYFDKYWLYSLPCTAMSKLSTKGPVPPHVAPQRELGEYASWRSTSYYDLFNGPIA